MNTYTKKIIRKLSKGNHTMASIKRYIGITDDEYDGFIENELKKKLEKELKKTAYSGRNIRYQ